MTSSFTNIQKTSSNLLASYTAQPALPYSFYSGTADNYYLGRSFQTTNKILLDKAQFSLERLDNPTVTLTAYIYDHTGTYGVDGTPTGSPIATSDSVLSSALDQTTISYNYVASSYSESYYDDNTPLSGVAGGSVGAYDAVGQVFTNTNAMDIIRARFYAKKVGSPTGYAYAYIWTTYPYGNPSYGVPFEQMAVSDAVDVSTWTTSMALRDFTFSGDQQYTLEAGRTYAIYIQYLGGDNSSNYLIVGDDGSSPADPNNFLLHVTGSWLYNSPPATYQLCYYIYGTSTTDYGGSIGSITTNNFEWIDFDFTGTDRINLDANSNYFVVIHAVGTISGTSTIYNEFSLVPPFTGNGVESTDGITWTPITTNSIEYKIYGISQWSDLEKSQQEFNNNNIN
jgi:hypothetical protein